jgi:hypothetical protein
VTRNSKFIEDIKPHVGAWLLILEGLTGLGFLGDILAIFTIAGDVNGGDMVFKYFGELDVFGIAKIGGFVTLNLFLALYYLLRPFINTSDLFQKWRRLAGIIFLLILIGVCTTYGTRATITNIMGRVLPTSTLTPTLTPSPIASLSPQPPTRNLEIHATCEINNLVTPCQIKTLRGI